MVFSPHFTFLLPPSISESLDEDEDDQQDDDDQESNPDAVEPHRDGQMITTGSCKGIKKALNEYSNG